MLKKLLTLLITGMCFLAHSSCLMGQAPKLHLSKFPQWLFTCSEKDSLHNYAIGMSDPKLDKEVAKKQAVQRAVAILSLSEGFSFSKTINSFRLQNKHTTVSAKNLSLMTFSSNFDSLDVKLEKIFFSDFKECFVLISKPKCNKRKESAKPFKLEAEYFITGGKSNFSVANGLISFNIKSNQSHQDYTYRKYFIKGRVEIASYIGLEGCDFSDTKYVYKDIIAAPFDSLSESCSTKLSNSFWDAYISSIIKSLNAHYNENVGLKSYKSIDKGKNRMLDVALVDEKYFFSVNGMYIRNNSLIINTIIK